jgi:hypothetical protein
LTLYRIKKRGTERIRICVIKDGKEDEGGERRYFRVERRRKKKGGDEEETYSIG